MTPVSVPYRPVVQLYHHEFSCITMFDVAPFPEGAENLELPTLGPWLIWDFEDELSRILHCWGRLK